MRGLHLMLVKGFDERAGRSDKPMNGRAVERNLHDTLADAANQSVIRIAFLTAREIAQRRFDRRPIGFLCGREMQRALDARDVDRRADGLVDNKLKAASAITPAHTLILISINPLRFPSRKLAASTFQIRR